MCHDTLAPRLKQILPENLFGYCHTCFLSSCTVINFYNTKSFCVTITVDFISILNLYLKKKFYIMDGYVTKYPKELFMFLCIVNAFLMTYVCRHSNST
jgi:hypothetical protein